MTTPLDRRSLLGGFLAAGAAACAREPEPAPEPATPPPAATPAPALFVGHGSPLNVLEGNRWYAAFRALGAALPRPRAILCVSAHWATRGFRVTTDLRPRTIHDFGGFPDELYALRYPAPGEPALAERVRALCGAERVAPSTEWGLDHGAWCVLAPMFPAADVPVVELSLDRSFSPQEHLELARALAPLRDEGVLVLGSGNVTHNLGDYFARLEAGDAELPGWARAFDADVAAAAAQHDVEYLARAVETRAGRQAHPTLEHYLPLLAPLALARAGEAVTFPIEGFDGSLSMRAIRVG